MISNFRDGYKKLTADKDVAIKIAGKAVLKLRKKIFLLYEYLQIKQHYGDFRLDRNYNAQQIKGLSNYCFFAIIGGLLNF